MVSRAFPVFYTTDVESVATFWERLGFERHYQLPTEGEPGYVGLRTGTAELAGMAIISIIGLVYLVREWRRAGRPSRPVRGRPSAAS